LEWLLASIIFEELDATVGVGNEQIHQSVVIKVSRNSLENSFVWITKYFFSSIAIKLRFADVDIIRNSLD